MSKKRVHELAKELGMDNREVVLALQAAGISVKTHSSSVYEEEALAVLNKVKSPVPEAPKKRPGMVIVKRRQQDELEGGDEAEQAETGSGLEEIDAVAEASPSLAHPEPAVVESEPVHQAQHEASPSPTASMPMPMPGPVPEEPIPSQHVVASAAPPQRDVSEPQPSVPAAAAPPQSESQSADRVTVASHPKQVLKEFERAPGAYQNKQRTDGQSPHRDSPRHEPYRAPERAPVERQGGDPANKAPRPGAPPGQVILGGEGQPTKPTRPGAATVVRMIDRDKLLERVPGRRLGGGPPGAGNRGGGDRGAPRPASGAGGNAAPGQRYGQVTELKVVTDPFGRGREMVTVGRDKKKATPGQPNGLGAGKMAPGGRRGRPGNRREMSDMRERSLHPARLKKKKANKRTPGKAVLTQPKASKRIIKMKENIVVADLAHQLGVKSVDLVRKLMALGSMTTQNQSVDFETAQLLATEYEYTVESVAFTEDTHIEIAQEESDTTNKVSRPPVVTVMGHVDHGKTSLLDAIRKARVAKGEAGGITQHIGAYSVPVGDKGSVTFLDTPGHAAFTSMRARGAQITDLVVLVVAADDGVMPQTEEAIKHAQAAKVPIIVAVNKIDKPDANAERVMQELTKFELLPEDWGGDTLYVPTSATKGTGISELLEAILLQAEVLELTANPSRSAMAVVVEAQLDKGRGPVATVLVQQGTLKRGDAIVVGSAFGRIRAMRDDQGVLLKEAGPSAAVEITGLDAVPAAGDTLNVVESPEAAREVAEHRSAQKRQQEQGSGTPMSLDDLMKRMESAGGLELKVVLKADVQGSVEAVKGALLKLSTDEVKVNVIYGGVGGISESDIMLAAASGGLVLGFGVRPDTSARQIGEREGVEIRTYNIIYEAVDDVARAMEGLLTPESREKIVGRAEVRELFKVSKVGTVGGSRVTEGKAMRSARVRVVRDSVQVYDGKVLSLRHFKNDAREVDAGLECGVGVEGYNDLKIGDVIEFYTVEEIARTLSSSPSNRRSPPSGSEAHP